MDLKQDPTDFEVEVDFGEDEPLEEPTIDSPPAHSFSQEEHQQEPGRRTHTPACQPLSLRTANISPQALQTPSTTRGEGTAEVCCDKVALPEAKLPPGAFRPASDGVDPTHSVSAGRSTNFKTGALRVSSLQPCLHNPYST